MAMPTAQERFPRERKFDLEEYNYAHFQTKHLLFDMKQTLRRNGIQPGTEAPDFELPRADGGTLRLSKLRGKPVLLHFGSFT